MLWTLLSGAFRDGAGQLRITSLPCCAPERSSVRCWTRSTGGRGGRRLPQPARTATVNRSIPQRRKGTKKANPEDVKNNLPGNSFLCAFAPLRESLTECNDSDLDPSQYRRAYVLHKQRQCVVVSVPDRDLQN